MLQERRNVEIGPDGCIRGSMAQLMCNIDQWDTQRPPTICTGMAQQMNCRMQADCIVLYANSRRWCINLKKGGVNV